MSIRILLIFDLRNYFVIYFCCGVIAIWANIDIVFDGDLLNLIQVFLSYFFPNKRFYSIRLCFDGDRFSPRKVQYCQQCLLLRQTRGLDSITAQIILMFDVSNNNYFVAYWFVVALLYLFGRIVICFFDFGVLNANHVFLFYVFPISRFIRCWYALMAIVFCIERHNIVNKFFLLSNKRQRLDGTSDALWFKANNLIFFVVRLRCIFFRITILFWLWPP